MDIAGERGLEYVLNISLGTPSHHIFNPCSMAAVEVAENVDEQPSKRQKLDDVKSDDVKSDDVKSDDVKSDDVKSEVDKENGTKDEEEVLSKVNQLSK